MQSRIYLCPLCGGGLGEQSASLTCTDCSRSFPTKDGIIDFRDSQYDYYFNPVPPDEMDKLNKNFKPERWAETVRKFLEFVQVRSGWIDNIAADGRYSWKMFLDLKPDSQLLDLGCGLGNLTTNLAPHVGKVYAMDLTYKRLEFAKNRFATFNQNDDITLVAGGDSARLPFQDNCMDFVVLSGVLEWAGEGDTDQYLEGSKLQRLVNSLRSPFGKRSPRLIQLNFLKEIRRILKPEGQIFVAIENRLNYEYFLGRRDHHSFLIYGSLLPRVLANLWSLYKRRQPYRTYTHSLMAYKRLMADAGFPVCDFLGMLQGYSKVNEIVPASGDFPYWRPVEGNNWRWKLKRSKLFVPAYGIIGSSQPRPWANLQEGIYARITAALADEEGRGDALKVHRYQVTGKQKLVVHASCARTKLLIKHPFNSTAVESERNNYKMLEWLATNRPALHGVPRAITSGEVGGQIFFAESAVHGQALKQLANGGRRAEGVKSCLDYLVKLNPPETLEHVVMTGEVYDEYVGDRLAVVAPYLSDPAQVSVIESFFRKHLMGSRLPLGVRHGDFSASNILIKGGEVCGVFDWEAGSTRGIPVLDAICLLNSAQYSGVGSAGLADSVSMLASRQWPYPEEFDLLMDFYSTMGVDPQCHQGLCYLSWLHGMGLRLQYGMAYDTDSIEKYIHNVARTISLDGLH